MTQVSSEPSGLLPLDSLQRGHQTTQHGLALLGAHGQQDQKHFAGPMSLIKEVFDSQLTFLSIYLRDFQRI